MAACNHSFGSSGLVTHTDPIPANSPSRARCWCGALIGVYLAVGCGGKPELMDSASPSAAGATTYYAQPRGGSGPQIQMIGGTAGMGNTEGPSICGNGTLERKEVCDDGNTVDADGCSADCALQDPHYDCSTPNQLCTRWVNCGNGKIEFDEVCDDGNAAGGDGCTADCGAVERGYGCAKPGNPCILLPQCGNGLRERGESCDDGETVPSSGDGCSIACQTEAGFWCHTSGQPCVKETCGDGQRTPNEVCDDRNALSGDGCSERCQIETGWRCTALGCSPLCGDGLLVKGEECDDSNHVTGDGCSAACRVEPYFACAGQPSRCTSTITCGNGIREPGEICDPPGKSGCLPGCRTFAPDVVVAPTSCGNAAIEIGESCDPPAVGNGCAANCAAESGWVCPRPGLCSRIPFCGDGIVNVGEKCDDGNSVPGDGCNSCGIELNWNCYGLGPSKCVPEICGDGILSPKEQCDDRNAAPGDGCSANCNTETGWVCPVAGVTCRPRCGDGVIVGSEACDDGNIANLDGCNAGCRVEPGFNCPGPSQACVPSACGNEKVESGESCDDKNLVAGDGCGPTCQREPTITPGPSPVVKVVCGDGLLTDAEECDDGNTTDSDGCGATCLKELGFECESKLNLPSSAEFQVTYRDFKAANATIAGGHPDFQYKITNQVPGIPGPPCRSNNGTVCGRLDNDGKPVLQASNVQATTGIKNAATFGLFFRSTNPLGITGENGPIQIKSFTGTLKLNQTAVGSEAYSYDAQGQFFPLNAVTDAFGPIGAESPQCNNGQGVYDLAGSATGTPQCDTACGSACQAKNFNFTTELRYFFQYRGGETLTFRGDDDVWVYINGRLAVDIGGVHDARYGRVILGDDGAPSGTDSNCSVHSATTLAAAGDCYSAAETSDATDVRFDLAKGKVYEIVLFHAERHTNQSNFLLTLSGFLAPRSYCRSICGDGRLVAGEVCDDGANNRDNVSGACNTTCNSLAFCGDGVIQAGEQCDNGRNADLYLTAGMSGACAPGCVLPPTCGDGLVQGTEQCDNGSQNTNGGYGPTSCTTSCNFGGYCGDGTVNGSEVCDAGAKNGTSYGAGSCGYDCKSGPYYCGDGVRNGSEECDEGPAGGLACDKSCKLIPYCGDGILETGEACDYGQFASATYGSCTNQCVWSARCGDKVIDAPNEECDDGTAGNIGGYGGCTANCTLGPRCGDAALQTDQGERCDNGYNNDTYEYSPTACGPNCQRPPYCGDGNLMPGYELCDGGVSNSDVAYGGCNTHCEWGPYCGDGKLDTQGGELCDKGRDNVVYGMDGSACGLDCKPAPYCGDGERNGSEQCDLGTTRNAGVYGTCMPNCTLPPRCGDKLVQAGEQCDDGPTGSPECSISCKDRGQLL